jgi:tetratricopeptide (TPR) repeat protein
MKRKERHHLKENALAQWVVAARDFVEPRWKQLAGVAIVVAVALLIGLGVMFWRSRGEARGEDLLAEAMVALNARVVPTTNPTAPGELPAAAELGATGSFATEEAKLTAALPKLKAAADAYPDSSAGIQARYHYAGALAALGRNDEAVKAFEEVEARAGAGSLYGRMAALGKADTQLKAGQVDAAITTWKDLAARKDGNLPEDAILMELGRAYQAKGDKDEATKTYTQLVDQFPASPYAAEARAALDTLKG